MKIILDKCNTKCITAAKLWIKDGSRADPIGKKGIHQIVSSTICRGCGPYNNKQIAEIVESSGAILNCDTYEDGLLISLKCIRNDIYKLLPLIGWMITKPCLYNDQIELEKDLTIKALKRQKENAYQQAFDAWRKMIYKDGPYGHDPLGSIDDLYKVKKEHILPIANSLVDRKKILVISGAVPENIDKYIEDSISFKGIRIDITDLKKIKLEINTKENIHKNKVNICTKYLNTQQVVLLLGKATVSYSNEADLFLRLISCYLGYGMSSLLFKILREKYGVVYEAGIYHPVRESQSPFIMHASTTEEKAILTIKLLKDCWEQILHTEIPEEELNLVKTKFKGQMAYSLQSISQKAERKAHLLGIGLKIDHDKKIQTRLASITSKEILNAAKLYLKNPSLSICSKEEVALEVSKKWHI